MVARLRATTLYERQPHELSTNRAQPVVGSLVVRGPRHTPREIPQFVEDAARKLAVLCSPGCAWIHVPRAGEFGNADVFNKDGELDESPPELRGAFRIFSRGTTTMRRTAGVDGVRGLRFHNASKAAITPRGRRADRVAMALSFANLAPVTEAWLLTYAGDFQRWPFVRDVACALRPGRSWAAAVEDAGHGLVFARAVMPAAERALQLRERKSDVLALRRDAEALLIRWLELASRDFLAALHGPEPLGFPNGFHSLTARVSSGTPVASEPIYPPSPLNPIGAHGSTQPLRPLPTAAQLPEATPLRVHDAAIAAPHAVTALATPEARDNTPLFRSLPHHSGGAASNSREQT